MNRYPHLENLKSAGWRLAGIAVLLVCVCFYVGRQVEQAKRGDSRGSPSRVSQPEAGGSRDGIGKSHRKENSHSAAVRTPASGAAVAAAAPVSAPAAPAPADADPMGKLLAGEPLRLLDRGRAATFELALDELYLPFEPVGKRLVKVKEQPDAASLIRLAESMRGAQGETPGLVIYLAGEPRKEGTRRILTDRVLLQLSDAADAAKIADAAEARIVSQPDYAPGHVVVEPRVAQVAGGLGVVGRLAGQKGVISAEALLARQQAKRATIPNDALFSQQWHLRNTGQGGGTPGADAAVTDAWDTHMGSGITIAVVDDGVELTHPDISPNADATHHYDWNDFPEDTNPAPDPGNDDFHGTSVAGVAAARGGNNIGVSGAAPQATIVGFRLIAEPTTDQDDAGAMALHNNVIHIKNNSWGPPDDEPWELGEAGPLFLAAVQNGTTNGRGGKGIIYTWAAGNGRDLGDQSNKDGYANSIHTFAIGAVTNTGALSYYSETGSNLIVVAPSNGGSRSIVTTDLVGNTGYNDGTVPGELSNRDYTNDFGGTSSASPLASGVIALMLEANPNLTWRDVKEILLRSSTKLSPADSGWVSRSSGDPSLAPIKHNQKFGGGMVHASAAVAMAAAWPARPPMTQMSQNQSYGSPGATIPDNNSIGVQASFDFSSQPAMRVEHVEVTLTASHTARGDLQVLLTSPGGVVSTLAAVTFDDYDDGNLQFYDAWTFSSVRHWGESSVGTWKVTVRDLAAIDTGRVQSVGIRLSGMDAPLQDIAVEQPAGTNLTDQVSTVDYGNVAMDNPATKVFTLKNVGDFALTGIAASITGADQADFNVTVSPPSALNASGLTTFSVQFAPGSTGLKQATLHIASNDPDEAPFDIDLAGEGTPAVGFLAFGAPAFTVLETDGPIQIPLVRTGGVFGDVTVSVNTVNGTAVAPGDFTAQIGSVVDFDDGVVSGFVEVPIVNNPATSEANETFTMTLTDPTNGLRLGTPSQVPVTIIDSSALSQTTDTAAPGVPVVTSPAEGALLPLDVGSPITVTGSATDNKGIQKVELSLNGGSFIEAALGIPGAPSTTFSQMVTPITGTNVLLVKSTDYSGRTTTRTRNFKATRPLLVHVDTSLGAVTTAFVPSSFREVGKSLTITATPKLPTTTPAFPGAIFAGWTLGGQDVANGNAAFTPQRLGMAASSLEKQTITLIFREGLELTANFVPSPFGPLAGTYNGLIRPAATKPDRAPLGGAPGPEDGSVSHLGTEGFFTATLDNKGSFSAKLTIDGLILSFAGAFDGDGNARFGTSRALSQIVPRVNKPSFTVSLRATDTNGATAGGQEIQGTLTATEFRKSVIASVSGIVGERAFYGGRVLTGAITAGSAVVSLSSTADRTVGEVVTGAGIPANTTIVTVDPAEITLSANATATKTAASLTFTRNVDAAYLNASHADGVFTILFPARAPHYEAGVTMDDTTDELNAGPDNPFQNGSVIAFKDDGSGLPAPLVAGQEYFVVNKSGATFQVSVAPNGGAVDLAAPGSAVAVLDPGTRQIEGFTSQDYPQGTGVGTLKITKAGGVVFTGTLADGTAVTASSTLSSARTMPLFARLYSLKGFLSALAKLKDTPLTNADPDLLPAAGSEVLWLRPFLLNHYYPYGWPEVIRVDLLGAKYDATGLVLRNADNTPLGPANLTDGNATLIFSGGQLTEDLIKTVSITGTNVVTKAPDPLDPTFSLKITGSTGAVGGSFTHTDDTKPVFQGIIFQKGPDAGAHGFFLTKQPAPIDYTGESGGVSLMGSP